MSGEEGPLDLAAERGPGDVPEQIVVDDGPLAPQPLTQGVHVDRLNGDRFPRRGGAPRRHERRGAGGLAREHVLRLETECRESDVGRRCGHADQQVRGGVLR